MLKVSGEPLLQDRLPLTDPANLSARVLRLGLAVTAFAMLEKYVGSVFDHLVEKDVGAAHLGFAALPDGIRDFIVVDSTIGMNNRLSFLRGAPDRINYVTQTLELVVKYKDAPPSYTALGFSPKGSNVGHDDIKQAFGTFGVKDPWSKMNSLAAAFGGAALSLQENYKNLAGTRHKAAHDPVSSIPVADLQSNIRSAIVIGICCDVLAKNAGAAIKACQDKKNLEKDVATYSRDTRFLDEQADGSWLERPFTVRKGTKLYPNRAIGIAGAVARAAKPFVIVRDRTGQPIELAG
ncbi:hypothetical protein [Labrys monachus]|uniref:RiboL-PSP-HEPN domain-containing protein n=1 Tax=Labrys monachus TaxID=217067 RepID=A0ABU0FMF1_9HYPH|nr:hypothetical protein [Labrys monachus]MDQ0395783.1 hypothetical protein [Labrys monachus]